MPPLDYVPFPPDSQPTTEPLADWERELLRMARVDIPTSTDVPVHTIVQSTLYGPAYLYMKMPDNIWHKMGERGNIIDDRRMAQYIGIGDWAYSNYYHVVYDPRQEG